MPRNKKTQSRAFTLVELVVSMSVAVVLFGGIASAMMIAGRAIPRSDDPSRASVEGYYAAEQIAEELFVAQSITQRAATFVEFTVADRDNDSVAETIRYEWSGAPGDALLRQYNGGATAEIVRNINEFTLGYNTRIESTTTTMTVTSQSPDIELAFFDGWDGQVPTQFGVSSTWWLAEYLIINPPAGVTTMNISRVQLMTREGTADPTATITVGIYKPAAVGKPIPQATPIGTPAVRLTTSLPVGYAWTDFTFSDVVINAAETEYVILVKGTTQGAANVRYYNWRSAPADTHILITSTDGGATWDPRANAYDQNDMPFHIYGTSETTTTQEHTTNRFFLESVNITVQTGTTASSRVETATRTLNAPEVTGL